MSIIVSILTYAHCVNTIKITQSKLYMTIHETNMQRGEYTQGFSEGLEKNEK